jgi:hypothetical protein
MRVLLVGCSVIAVACGSKPTARSVDITQLAFKDASTVDSLLGKPTRILPTLGTPDEMPGEVREYDLGPREGVAAKGGRRGAVRFYKNKAVYFEIDLPKPVKDPREALKEVGLDASNAGAYLEVPTATRWRGEISKLIFKDVSAVGANGGRVANVGYSQVFAALAK